jgi:hypothetical protein
MLIIDKWKAFIHYQGIFSLLNFLGAILPHPDFARLKAQRTRQCIAPQS